MSTFSRTFLDDHAGNIIKDSPTAVMEIIANSYDAGATEIRVKWPDETGQSFEFKDNGIGLSAEEFSSIWEQLSFRRTERFGDNARVPPQSKDIVKNRRAFGKNGKGRHAPFRFCRSFNVFSKSASEAAPISKLVSRSESAEAPFKTSDSKGTPQKLDNTHGTIISGILDDGHISVESVKELVGSKFLVDPSFKIFVNDDLINLQDLGGLTSVDLRVDENHTVKIHFFTSNQSEQKIRFKGVAWWVNSRLVGEPSWSSMTGKESYIDGRFDAAKKVAFIIQADHLEKDVHADWSGLKTSDLSNKTAQVVDKFIREKLHDLTAVDRQQRKENALEQNISEIRDLSPIGQATVVTFVEDAINSCKKLTQEDLNSIVDVFVKLEKSKSGFNLVKELSKCSPDDLDKWNDIVSKWSASTAHLVLDEIHKRMVLIDKLSELIVNPGTKELQEIQPIFNNGLWIFGPEYEGILDFFSNKTLKTILEEGLGGKKAELKNERLRPDFFVSVYSSDMVNSTTGLATDIAKALIIELKTTGVAIGDEEINQGKKYAKILKEAGKQIKDSTPIDVYVLGTKLEAMAEPEIVKNLNIRIFPCSYDGIIQQAHARLLYLQRRIEKLGYAKPKEDAALEKALAQGTQLDFVLNK